MTVPVRSQDQGTPPVDRPTVGGVIDRLRTALVEVSGSNYTQIDTLWPFDRGTRPQLTVHGHGSSAVQRDLVKAAFAAVGVFRLPVPVNEGHRWSFRASSDECGVSLRVLARQGAWPPDGAL